MMENDSETVRDLTKLPKAHLHLHFSSGAVARRETLEELACSSERVRDCLLAEAEGKIKEAEETGNQAQLEKYQRRAQIASSPDIITSTFGLSPPERGSSEDEVVAEVQHLNSEDCQPGASGIWDQQFVTRGLLSNNNVGSEAETFDKLLREVYEDAIHESIVWVELIWETLVKGEATTIEDSTAARWFALMDSWIQLEKEFSSQVGVRFVLGCPKHAHGAVAMCKFLHETCTLGAVCGVGQWGLEVSSEPRTEAFEICRRECGLPAVCVHAGEHALQAGYQPGDSAYDGPGMIRIAMEAAKAQRIGHGIEAAKCTTLMGELAGRYDDICLEICPISNLRLGYLPPAGLTEHPLPQLLGSGVACCLASDDPAFFGSRTAHGLTREYVAARHLMGLTDEQLAELARVSITHSLAPAHIKESGLKAIESWLANDI